MRNTMNKYPTLNPLHRKEIDNVLKTLEMIRLYEQSLSVELMKEYGKYYTNRINELEQYIEQQKEEHDNKGE